VDPTPPIGGDVGPVRTRFPIMPMSKTNGDFQADALRDITFPRDDYDSSKNPAFGVDRDIQFGVRMNLVGGSHSHSFFLPPNLAYKLIKSKQSVVVTTEVRNSHQHTVKMTADVQENGIYSFKIVTCDSNPNKCSDNHQFLLRVGPGFGEENQRRREL